MITPSQIRGARAILGLSQEEAATGAGISLNTLSKTESGASGPSSETARKLQDFYEGCGLEFGDGDSIKRVEGDREYRNEIGMRKFFDDVYEEARHGTEICIFNGVPDLLVKWAGEEFYTKHATRMASIKSRFSVRVIVKEGEQNLIGSGFAEYRGIDAALFHDRTFYVYGDKVAFFTFGEDLSIKVMVGADLADSMRVMFNFAWAAAE